MSGSKICAAANQWDGAKKVLKLSTLLEGKALAIWLELSTEQKADYAVAKEQLIAKMAPTEFASLEEFHSRKLRPGEAITLYLYDLKQLLRQAMPEMEADASKPLFLHQFLSGLPTPISHKLRVTGDTKELDVVVQLAKVLMTVSEQEQVAAMHTVQQSPHEVEDLKMQITELTEQVVALTAQQKSAGPKRCFYYNKLGHTQRNCPGRPASQRCYICNRPDDRLIGFAYKVGGKLLKEGDVWNFYNYCNDLFIYIGTCVNAIILLVAHC